MSAAQRLYRLRWVVLPPLTGIGILAMLVGAVVAAPRELVEGDVQRLMYIHIPSAFAMYLAVAVLFAASIMVLWKRDMRWDAAARGAAGVGVLFSGFALATGSLWGKPTWGVYWQWDARLTSTLVLFLILIAYLLARTVSDPDDEQSARYSAVYAIVGSLDVPLIMMSVRWWRTLHPQPIVARLDPQLPGSMGLVLLISTIAILLLTVWLIALRTDTERLGQRLLGLRAAVDRREEA
ncbi:MAG: cytochrome C assembly protein [Chloroflexi bacterium]|nr:MAG: cytochrome C assembly protein [Chloroflexota bacterium]